MSEPRPDPAAPRGAAMDFERALVLDTVRVTEQAAIAAARVAGKGDADLVDQAGVDAMRRVLNELDIDGEIVIGEGERDEAPMLYIGEQVGQGGPDAWPVDIAVDPVEGTDITARMVEGSGAVIALSEKGGLFQAPDTYMEKLVVPAARGGQGRPHLAGGGEPGRHRAGARPRRHRPHDRHPRPTAPRRVDPRRAGRRRAGEADRRRRRHRLALGRRPQVPGR
ncbi:MAG: fructose-bisphosphatase class II [Trueperaceae bacterium]|nr:fructose-bisphosphatase class II [Trueperaceae bacterium]